MRKIITISILSIIVFACSHKTSNTVSKTETIPAITETVPSITESTTTAVIEKTESSTVTNEQFLAGKSIYVAKCGKCHKLKEPSRGNMTQWTSWLNRMAPKAKLTEEEKLEVTNYISVNAKTN